LCLSPTAIRLNAQLLQLRAKHAELLAAIRRTQAASVNGSQPFEEMLPLARLLDRLRARSALEGRGSGRGLHIVRGIGECFGGSVKVGAEVHGRGAGFTVRMPMSDYVPARGSGDSKSSLIGGSRGVSAQIMQLILCSMATLMCSVRGHVATGAIGDGSLQAGEHKDEQMDAGVGVAAGVDAGGSGTGHDCGCRPRSRSRYQRRSLVDDPGRRGCNVAAASAGR